MIDPYRDWLGIKASDLPINHYQLLGLSLFEADRERIENAEMMQMGQVLRHEEGPHVEVVRRVCDELEAAVRCLLDSRSKAAYDAALRESMAEAAPNCQTDASFEISATLLATATAEEEDVEPVAATPAASSQTASPFKAPSASPAKGASASPVKAAAAAPAKRTAPVAPPKAPKRPPRKQSSGESRLANLPLAKVASIAGLIGCAIFAVMFVQGLGNARPDAAPAIAKLKDTNPQVRLNAINELQHVEITPEAAAQHLLEVVEKDQDDNVRDAAARQMASLGPAVEPVLPRLKELASKERHTGVKITLQWMIEKLGRP